MQTSDIAQLGKLVDDSKVILLLQPDKPDGDSVASALALDEILAGQGKAVSHFTAGRVEDYLSHLPGWDRIGDVWPASYDLAILVDTGSNEQIPRLLELHKSDLVSKPFFLIDHHKLGSGMSHLTGQIIDEDAAATGELIYAIAQRLKWTVSPAACALLVSSILADTLNLTTPKTSPRTVRAFADIVEAGNVNLNLLNQRWREASAYDPDLIMLKGRLLSSIELYADNQIALITANKELLDEYRQRTNLAALVFFDLINARGIKLAIFVNDYGTIIRTSLRSKLPIAADIAGHFGGGGHDMAAAFPTTDKTLAELKPELIKYASQVIHAQAS